MHESRCNQDQNGCECLPGWQGTICNESKCLTPVNSGLFGFIQVNLVLVGCALFFLAGKEPSAMRVNVLNWLTQVCLDLYKLTWF